MKIGFTGTRQGMSKLQREAFEKLLSLQAPLRGTDEFHHGDCVGSDEQAASVAESMGMIIVCHPPADDKLRAWSKFHFARQPRTHFARNRKIVDETEILIATPWHDKRPTPKTGGGTWYTIEYAERAGRTVHIVWPDGTVSNG